MKTSKGTVHFFAILWTISLAVTIGLLLAGAFQAAIATAILHHSIANIGKDLYY